MQAQAFRPRHDRLDQLLLNHARKTYPDITTLEHYENRPAILFAELFPPEDWLPRHFGQVARSAWVFVDQVFKPADSSADSPPSSHAKSVQVADVYELVVPADAHTVFLELLVDSTQPVLVPFPEIPEVLLGKRPGTLGDSQRALHELLWKVTERLNAMLPIAVWLAQGAGARA